MEALALAEEYEELEDDEEVDEEEVLRQEEHNDAINELEDIQNKIREVPCCLSTCPKHPYACPAPSFAGRFKHTISSHCCARQK